MFCSGWYGVVCFLGVLAEVLKSDDMRYGAWSLVTVCLPLGLAMCCGDLSVVLWPAHVVVY